ncbi:dynein heavy chain at 62B [Arctopsyche grandis]|uniref:dynein heavy chain at 62B n=1 Tax=Arctopsyche grandis TaxID=121162 RepID=UPI00406D6FBA
MEKKIKSAKKKSSMVTLQGMPQIHNYPFYNRKKAKYKKIQDYLMEKADKAKQSYSSIIDDRSDEEVIPIAQEKYINDLRQHVQKIVPTPMLKPWENKILHLIPIQLRKHHVSALKTLVDECKTDWSNCLHNLIVKSIIRDEPGVDRKRYIEKSFKFGGKTENYQFFLNTKIILKEKLFLVHPFMRKVLDTAITTFPLYLVDISSYRSKGLITVEELFSTFHKELLNSETLIRDVWYKQLLVYFKMNQTTDVFPPKAHKDFFSCLSKSIAMQIIELMRRSIVHIIDIVKDPEKIPMIYMELKFDSDIKLLPSLEKVYSTYTDMIKSITQICQNLPDVVEQENSSFSEKYMKIEINEWVYENCRKLLKEKIIEAFTAVAQYVSGLESEFHGLILDCSDIASTELVVSHEKIKIYKVMNEKLASMINSENFTVGRISQGDMLSNLRSCCFRLQDNILNRMSQEHKNEVIDICGEFEVIAERALATPADATDLMASGAYCLRAKTVLIEELQERIEDSVIALSQLIDMTTLSDEHIGLNTKMINWLQEIQPILKQNAINYETIKYEMEENLMAKTNDLGKKITDILPYLEILDEMDDINNTFSYLEDIRKLVHWIKDCEEEVAWINKEETVFKFPLSQYSDLEELKDYILPFYELMYLLHRWRRSYYAWMDGPFEYIDSAEVQQQHEEYCREFTNILKQYKSKIKQQISDNNERRFKGLVEDPDPMNLPAPMKLCAQALNELKEWRPHVQLVNIMCNSALRQRHWDEMSSIAKFDLTPDAGTTIRKLIKLNLKPDMGKYEIISVGACKELTLITNLKGMISEWDCVNFTMGTYRDTDIKVLVRLEDIQTILDDQLMKSLGMRGSAFVKPFETEVKDWYQKLTRVNNVLDNWIKIQQQRISLLPFFSSKDIMNQMPQESVMFREVDNTYNIFIKMVEKVPLVIETAAGHGLLETMDNTIILIEKINSGVNEYIEKKRLFFPRLFFLSNDEILDILSETENPAKVQPHLKKCFEGIYKLDFDDDLNILGMISEEGELVKYRESISTKKTQGAVEKWLVQVEQQMLFTIRDEIKRSFEEHSIIHREDWISKWEGMVVLCVSQIYWALDVHSCLKSGKNNSLEQFHGVLQQQLNNLVEFLRSPGLKNITRITIKALIVIDVHAKDVIQELIDKKVKDDNDFNWLAQLRYYWEEDMVIVRIINASVKFAYEYLGNSDRLVITPLTDRCYRTLVGAFDLNLNGAPEGPAGTGKTETTKDLAKALAKQCIVFNCSDDLDYKSMGRFFKGLACSGAWACFDEFNRIDVEVLSVIAQQILSIVQAVRAKVATFYFEGTQLKLNPTCYICITMNPGYAGRSELPDNLKVLFRTVAMMVPDYALISEVSLYSYGFLDARRLSVKIVTTYRLCSEQLSSQKHYDYGMRAVKTVLSACGRNKIDFPAEDENLLLLRSLIDVNLPKFLSCDVPLFESIVSDLFPGLTLPPLDLNDIKSETEKYCKEINVQSTGYFMTKIIETYQMMHARHGFMLVGDSYSGKSTILKTLAGTLSSLNSRGFNYDSVEYSVINPKSIESSQLFGAYDRISNEWIDGVVADIFRKFAIDEGAQRKWIIFDGPIDAVWIENMNTVLDDNKKLCLTSGEIISMSKKMSMIFEVMDVSQASPATVSRCGMIYMESNNLGYAPFVKSWINGVTSTWKNGYEEYLSSLCDWLFPPLLSLLKELDKPDMTGGEINLVITTLRLINMLMADANPAEEDAKYVKTWIQASFIFAIIWGIGGNLSAESKKRFDETLRDIWKNEKNIPETLEKMDVSIPFEGLLSEYLYIYKQKGSWKSWNDVAKNVKIIETPILQQMLIPTVETVKYTFLLELHIRHNTPMLLFGPTGTGKTFYVQKYIINQLSLEKYTPIMITFTSTTSATTTQDLILTKLYKQKNNTYGPATGKLALVFVDDMNMPEKEIYGAQPAIETLRQLLDQKFWYKSGKKNISNTLLVGTLGPVGGSRQRIYPRLLRHFDLFSINNFSEDTISKIFTGILQIGWKRSGFGNDVTPFITSIISATIDTYVSAISNMFPTTKKPHYIFNLRDISRVIQGCLLIKKESADAKKTFVKLWIHEVSRVFYDRLINHDDREWFFELLKKYVSVHFKESFEEICDAYLDEEETVTRESLKKLMFGTYLDSDNLEEDKKYEELPSLDLLHNKAMEALEDYNSVNNKKMDIVLFQYALEHLSKICRVLSIPEGSILLVGVGGSGRQSLSRLASSLTGKTLFQPEISSNYTTKSWHDDIKKILKESGGLSKEIVFLMTEEQILNERFLQDIDNLLNSGEIPNLFEIDEKQDILELVRLDAQGGNRNLDISPLQVMEFFRARCKTKLHVCLCLSPIGDSFRNRLRLYPSLVNCCTIDWFDSWPEDALEKVAYHYVENINLPNDIMLASIKVCKYFHMNAYEISKKFYERTKRHTYITSASFLDLINLFTKLTQDKQKELSLAKSRYINGLEKLSMAAEAVSDMQRELNELKPQLIIMAVKGAEMMEEIERETIEADKATVQVREDEKIANEQAASAQILKKDCEADLALAIPILEDAIAALNTLKPTDITLVKSMKNPPAAIKLVMAAVCVMKSIPPDRIPDPANPGRKMMDYWGPSKRLLGDMAFLQSLKEFDKDNIPVVTMAKIRKEYLPHKDFKPHIIAKASTAAEGLCKWVIAMDMYDAVAKVVAPKKAKLQAAETEFAATMAILDEKKAMVARLEKKLADLNNALEEANLKKQQLEEEVELCINKLHRAEKLIGGLGGEKNRWTKSAEILQTLYDHLAGDLILSCGIIAYLSPFTMIERYSIITEWKEYVSVLDIPFSDDYLFSKVLGTDLKIQNWYIAGLPKDQISTDNAIIQDTSIRWSLFIDPQMQANKWIKIMEKKNDIHVLKFSDKNYMETIKTCLEYGMPVLIENVTEELDAPIDPILKKNIYNLNGKDYIALGDNIIEYNKKFRLYMTTNMRNPHYHPEIFNKVTIINFALSKDGLEDQLLGIVVAKERPDLQEKRKKLIIESAENNASLKNIEDSILKTLQETKGDILEDEAAIEVLDSSKTLSVEILKRREAMKDTEVIINDFRSSYYSVAKHSAIVYYCITNLSSIDPMYQYSLSWFINLYQFSIEKANKSKILEKRLQFIRDTFTFNLYSNVTRSLFEKDKLTFSFILCSEILLAKDEINSNEFNYFLSGSTITDDQTDNPFTWLPKNSWDSICNIEEIPEFENFKNMFIKDGTTWKIIYDSPEPQKEIFPEPWNASLSDFKKLIVIRILRPDKLTDAIVEFVKNHIGEKYVNPPPFDIAKSYNDSNCLIPLIFILSPGSDPIGTLLKFTERMGFSNKLNYISLGQGQGEKARVLIEEAQTEGGWVCLQNCHLAVSWLIELENICENIDFTNTDISFRLWLTSYPTPKFPHSILQSSIKMTNEPPTGLKNNLTRLYSSEPLKEPEFYEGCPGKDKTFSKLLYGICFFHAVVQERKKFGSLGWNIPYGFDDSDFQISVMQLQKFLNQYNDVPYIALSYLTGECNYGGRVTDDWDRRLIITILKYFINPDVVNSSKYQFSELSSKYGLPKRCEYKDYLKHIENIPIVSTPEIFGLHANADIFRNYTASMNIITSLLAVYDESMSSASNENSDELITTLCKDIIEKLPLQFNTEIARHKYPIDYHESMNAFLIQEMERFNILINIITTSVTILSKSIKGLIVMTPEIQIQADSMLLGKIPSNWSKVSYPSLKPLGSYISDLVERLNILQLWFDDGKPSKFWITGFFFTQAFLTGAMQNHARKEKIPIDLLTFDCEIVEDNDDINQNTSCVYVYGPFFDGARWNSKRHVLDEQYPKILNQPTPLIKIFVIKKTDLFEGKRYKCPLYKTLERRGILATTGHSSNFVISLLLPSNKSSDHWTKRSVAMILQLNI